MVDAKDSHSRINKFRELMSKDQSMQSAGGYRLGFYGRVVAAAEAVCYIHIPSLSAYPLVRGCPLPTGIFPTSWSCFGEPSTILMQVAVDQGGYQTQAVPSRPKAIQSRL